MMARYDADRLVNSVVTEIRGSVLMSGSGGWCNAVARTILPPSSAQQRELRPPFILVALSQYLPKVRETNEEYGSQIVRVAVVERHEGIRSERADSLATQHAADIRELLSRNTLMLDDIEAAHCIALPDGIVPFAALLALDGEDETVAYSCREVTMDYSVIDGYF